MTSPSMRPSAARPARTASLRPSPPNAMSRSAHPAPAVPSGPGAAPRRGDVSSIFTNTTRSRANTATAQRTWPSKMTTALTAHGRADHRLSPAATAALLTAASAGTRSAATVGRGAEPATTPQPGPDHKRGIMGAGIIHRPDLGPTTKTAG